MSIEASLAIRVAAIAEQIKALRRDVDRTDDKLVQLVTEQGHTAQRLEAADSAHELKLEVLNPTISRMDSTLDKIVAIVSDLTHWRARVLGTASVVGALVGGLSGAFISQIT
jgi:hypothetical protein